MMKHSRFILWAFVALGTASCTLEDNVQEPQLKEQEITIEARRADDDQTRTYRDDADGSVWWTPGDAISLFYGSGTNGGSKFTSNATENTLITNFTGTITAITGGGEIAVEDTYFWGLYPYSEDASCDGTSVTMSLSKEQTAVPGSFATNTFPSLGRSQGLIMGFYNICGGMKISVTKEGIKKVTLKSANGELITGKAKVHFEEGIPVAEIIDGSDEVVLEAPAGEYLEVGEFYFIVIFPTTFSKGFSLKFETLTEEATVEISGAMTAKRSVFGKLARIDGGATYSQKTGSIPIEDDGFKDFLAGSEFDSNGDGEISYEEAAAIESLQINTGDIESIAGIEYMPQLKTLICRGSEGTRASGGTGRLTGLDVTNNPELEYIDCSYNRLESLDISKCFNLAFLDCSPMNDENGNNLLLVLHVAEGQVIPGITIDRDSLLVPNGTLIIDGNFTSIPVEDPDFKSYLVSNFDLDGNGEISLTEAQRITSIELNTDNIESLQGIEYMFNLQKLYLWGSAGVSDHEFSNGVLGWLDVSNNINLIELRCTNNLIQEIDLSHNKKLKEAYFGWNQLTNVRVSGASSLEVLDCDKNHLTSIDVSENTNLTHLYLYDNELEELDVSNNTKLLYLICPVNHLSSLDLSQNKLLWKMQCYSNNLTSLDVTNNPDLLSIMCSDNHLTTLDLSRNRELLDLYCDGNLLTSLDLSKNNKIMGFDCSPMADGNGNNLLATLYLAEGHNIEWVTTDRDPMVIPDETEIVFVPSDNPIDDLDEEQIVEMIDSVYFGLASESCLGRDLYWEQTCANDILFGRPSDYIGLASFTFNGYEKPLRNVFTMALNCMASCNLVIRLLTGKQDLSPIEFRVLGEAYMLRAYSHFLLAYRYGRPEIGAPFVAYETVAQDYCYQNPDQQESVMRDYELIVNDLQHAEAILPLFEDYGYEDRWRAHKASAAALMAKVYAYWATWDQSRWGDVIPCVNRLEMEYGRNLAPEYSMLFSPKESEMWNEEYCWGLLSEAGMTRMNIAFPVACLERDGWGHYEGWGQFKPSHDIYREMSRDNYGGSNKNDRLAISMLEYGDDFFIFGQYREFYSTMDYESGFMINKYMQAFAPSDPIGMGYVSGFFPSTKLIWPIVRFGDALLLRAEAYLATGDPYAATQDINRIRMRSNLQPLSGTATWADLYHERRCELAFELANDHAYDCKRWAVSGYPEIRDLALQELNNIPEYVHHEYRDIPASIECSIREFEHYSGKHWDEQYLTFPFPY